MRTLHRVRIYVRAHKTGVTSCAIIAVMASHHSRIVSSDPNVVLVLLERIDEADSDDHGWLGPDHGPIAYCSVSSKVPSCD